VVAVSLKKKLLEDLDEPGLKSEPARPAWPWAGPEHVLIVVNERVPESIAVGEHYRRGRGVPAENVCRVQCSAEETISRAEFEADIRRPVWAYLVKTGLSRKIQFIVTTHGVPLRITADRHPPKGQHDYSSDQASVDSELCLLGRVHARCGPIPNRYLHREEPFDSQRFGMFLVTRLDAASSEVVMRMVDAGLAVEGSRSLSARGAAYFDLDPERNRRGARIDESILANRRYLALDKRLAGRIRVEETAREFDQPDEVKDVFLYLGWHSNRYLPEVFSWMPGAVGVHFHPLSARSLRDPQACWVAGALADGLAFTAGSVFDPSTQGVNAFDDLYRYLHMGYTWAESAYMCLRFVSWQNVVIGDPLYRPFR